MHLGAANAEAPGKRRQDRRRLRLASTTWERPGQRGNSVKTGNRVSGPGSVQEGSAMASAQPRHPVGDQCMLIFLAFGGQ